MKLKIKSILFISFLLLSVSVVSAQFTGYTQYSYDYIGENLTVNFGTTLPISTVFSDITNYAPIDTLSNAEIQTKGKRIIVYAEGSDKVNQVKLFNITHDSDMQADGDDIRIISGDGTVLDQMLLSKSNGNYYNYYVEYPNVDDANELYYFLTYGNASLSAKNDTLTPIVLTTDTVTTDPGDSNGDPYTLVGTNTHNIISEYEYYDIYEVSINTQLVGSGTTVYSVPYKITVEYAGGGESTISEGSFSEDYVATTHTFSVDSQGVINQSMVVRLYLSDPAGSGGITQGNSFVTKAYEKYPTPTFEDEFDLQNEYTISSSVTGDTDTDLFIYAENNEQYIYPTGNISSISYTSDSPYWSLVTRAYWTEDTAIITETVNSTYAVIEIDYTPSDNITIGYYNTVFNTVDLTQFLGDATCTINGTPVVCTLDNSNVNITLSDLNAGQLYNILVSVPYNLAPGLISPANESSDNYSFPPLQHDITLNWNSTSADSYKYEVATDTGFNFIVATDEILVNTTTVSLNVPSTYYWRVYGNYDDTYSPASDVWSFTMNASSTVTGTGINGVVYDASNNVVSSATVNIYNSTWSDSILSSSIGYYQFTGLAGGETYYIQASKDGYSTSAIGTATVTTDEIYTLNTLLQKTDAANYILDHYVRFVVRSLFGGVYENVTVNVYEGSSATKLFTQTTGSDGAVGFELSESTQYRLTLYSETDDIDTTYTVTPTKESYNIYVSLTGESTAQEESDTILYGMHTDGNELNVTWNDTSGLTTLVGVTIKNRDNTTAYYLSSTDSNSYLTQEVNTTANSTYIVELSIESTGLSETFIRTHVISFDEGVKPAFDLGFTETWQSMFLAALSIIFVAVLFGSNNAHLGAILVAVSGLFHVFITGWIPATILTVSMMFIALIVSVAFYMRKSESI